MSFFDLIEQHYRVRPTANGFGHRTSTPHGHGWQQPSTSERMAPSGPACPSADTDVRNRDLGDIGAEFLQLGYGSQDAFGDLRLDRFGEAFLEDADAQPSHPAVQIRQHVDALRDAAVLTGIIVVLAGHCL